MFQIPIWLVLLHVALVVPTVAHALLQKRSSRGALGWIVFSIGYPIVGPVFYGLFGINRVRTRSRKLRDESAGKSDFHRAGIELRGEKFQAFESQLPDAETRVMRIGAAVSASPLRSGNVVEHLVNGESAYPRMIEAIDAARERVWIMTYIFETNDTGKKFIDALVRAHARGVDVRVIIDGVGEFYSWPHAGRLLRKGGVRVERYLRPRLFPPQLYVNLRNHRKILVVDSEVGFAGGMNIGGRHLVEPPETKYPVQDLHFRFGGKIVEDLERLFLHDWRFVSGEHEKYEIAEGAVPEEGESYCRLIPDGPDHDLNKLETVYQSVISAAEERVVILSPYFLPSAQMQSALVAAAIRGVDVTVVVPVKSNVGYVHAAMYRTIRWMLDKQVKVVTQPEPFSHAKLLMVDDFYLLCGSANVDPRSFRLNFEIGIEVIDSEMISRVNDYIEDILKRSTPLTASDLQGRPLWRRLIDGFVWLFSPYL